MSSLVLVRHAMPVVDPASPAHEWPLSSDGRADALRLVPLLPSGALLVASDEPKAYQTLEGAGPVVRDARFGEVRRTGEPWDGPFRELRRAYVEGTAHRGWEPHASVVARFDAAISEHGGAAGGRALVVASHGMAMTVWLTARFGLPQPGRFWSELRFPDAYAVDLAASSADTALTRLDFSADLG
ncbi:MAG: histidine phosphatase family protein [Micromonosporaceae bacterium]